MHDLSSAAELKLGAMMLHLFQPLRCPAPQPCMLLQWTHEFARKVTFCTLPDICTVSQNIPIT